MVAMSGGVDSSVAASLLVDAGHEVVGATLKLWGGSSDSGCCSVADVEDARRVADRLGIAHHVFNYTEEFDRSVVRPYVEAHAEGRTPNPCVECNRHVKFGQLQGRARRLGFDALATGHHARVTAGPGGEDAPRQLRRGVDEAKDQSYVLAMLGPGQLRDLLLPVGELTKDAVRAHARRRGLETATKPDSQDVCFIHSAEGRARFLGERTALHRGDVVDATSGEVVGSVPAVELVTVGQRRGLGGGSRRRRYAVAVDVPTRRVVVDVQERATVCAVAVEEPSATVPRRALAQVSAHGTAQPCTVEGGQVLFDRPRRPVAPGQTVAFYDLGDPSLVLGAAVAVALSRPRPTPPNP
jgi:tRNA-uridine 2-sulfurtransferase